MAIRLISAITAPSAEVIYPDAPGSALATTDSSGTGSGSTQRKQLSAPTSALDVPKTPTSGLLSGTPGPLSTTMGPIAQIAGFETFQSTAPAPATTTPNTGSSGGTGGTTGIPNTGASGQGLDQSLLNLVASMYAGSGNPADSGLGGLIAGPVGPATGADAVDGGGATVASSGLSTNAKILIAGLLGVAAWYFYKHHKKKKAAAGGK